MVIITFEGVDGVGKTTQMKYASTFLKSINIPHIATQEFRGDPTRESFRRLFMHELDGMQELMVVNLARLWHKEHILLPAIADGKVVLIDRYTESTWAYQHGGRGIPANIIDFLEKRVWQVPKPDLVIYLAGKSNRIQKNDRFEQEDDEFFTRIRKVYDSRQAANWYRIDTNEFKSVRKIIEQKLRRLLLDSRAAM